MAKAQSAKAFMITNPGYVQKIKTTVPTATFINTPSEHGFLVTSSLKMYYVTPSIEYQFYSSKWLELSIPLEIGVGYSNLSINDFFTNASIPILGKKRTVISGKDVFIPALLGLNLNINLSKDVFLSSSIGYRKIIKEVGISQNFDGIYYQIGLQLIPENIIKDLKKDYKNWKDKMCSKYTI